MEELIQKLQRIERAFMELAREHTGPKINELAYSAFMISDACGNAAKELKRNIPQEMEIEGGNTTYWNVCPECHGAIDKKDHFCRHCGQAVKEC